MKLETYLAKTNKSIETFAQEAGISAQAIYKYLRGERIPRKEFLTRLAKVTGGEVTANDFLEWREMDRFIVPRRIKPAAGTQPVPRHRQRVACQPAQVSASAWRLEPCVEPLTRHRRAQRDRILPALPAHQRLGGRESCIVIE